MFGATNEYMIFPILDIVNKEIKKALASDSVNRLIQQVNSGGQDYVPDPGSSESGDIIYDRNLLNALESNDYEVTFEKNDPSNTKLLTAIIIKYGETLMQKINLIRANNKLSAVRINIIRRQSIAESTANPYNMSAKDFVEYVRNKRKWSHYMAIAADEENTPEQIEEAQRRMDFIEVRNTQLRNLYMVDPLDDLPYDELIKFLSNPLAMDKIDFLLYMKNKRIAVREHPDITDAMVTQAGLDNSKIRERYVIDEDVYTYEELKPFLPNPVGLQDADFLRYLENKAEWVELVEETIPDKEAEIAAESDPVVKAELEQELEVLLTLKANIEERNQEIRDANFVVVGGTVTGFNDDYNSLTPYIPKDDSLYEEKMLFNILISLIYDSKSGKLTKVTSETGV